jgi:hypothetical protein
MLECSKNVFTEIPITLLELKMICVNQAWAKIICMRAMIYLNMKKLHARAENLYNSFVYSLDFYSSTKIFLVPMCDLEIGLVVLGEDLVICQ